MNGNDILVYMNGTLIAGARSDEIQTETEAIEVSSPTTGAWRSYVTGRKGWEVSTSYLVAATSALSALLNVGTEYTLTIRSRTSTLLTGTAILRTCSISAARGSLVTGTFQFIGTSSLT